MTASTNRGEVIPQYPFDPTGELVSNRITEVHTLSQPNRGEYNYFIPRGAPFFNKSVVITHVDTGDVLQYGKDYLFGGSYPEGTLGTHNHQPLSGVVVLLDKFVRGNYRIQYQTLGGEWALDEAEMIEILRNRITNPFRVHWLDILNKPNHYPPAYHGHPAHGLDTYGDHIAAFNRLIDVLENMISRDIEDRPDYTQLIVSIINQGRTLSSMVTLLDEHDDLLKKSVQGQLGLALKKIEEAQQKASELVNNLDQQINTKIDDRLAQLEAALRETKTNLNQLISELGDGLEARVTAAENTIVQQGKDFTQQIRALDDKVTNDVSNRITALGNQMNTDISGLRSELTQSMVQDDSIINNRINQVVRTIPDKLDPHFHSVTIDADPQRSGLGLFTPLLSGTRGSHLTIGVSESKDLILGTYSDASQGAPWVVGTEYFRLRPNKLIYTKIPVYSGPHRGYDSFFATRATYSNDVFTQVQGGMATHDDTKTISFPYEVTGDRTASSYYKLQASDFVTSDNRHSLTNKLDLAGGTMTGHLTVPGLSIATDKFLHIQAGQEQAGIIIDRSTSDTRKYASISSLSDDSWQFTTPTTSVRLQAKSGTIAFESDMLPVGAMVSFPNVIQSQPGFLLADGGTFDQNTYPDLYRALGNRNRLPNGNMSTDIGMTAWFATDEIPEGWIAFDAIRSIVTEQNYPEIYRILVRKYGAINRVPQVGDRFIRNAGNGLSVGSLQEDAIRNITGRAPLLDNGADDVFRQNLIGAFHLIPGSTYYGLGTDWNYNNPVMGFDASRVVPTAHENRPKNIVMKLAIKVGNSANHTRLWIKAYGRVTNVGTLNAEAIAADVQRLRNEKADRSHRHSVSDIDGLNDRILSVSSAPYSRTKNTSGDITREIIKYNDGTMIIRFIERVNDTSVNWSGIYTRSWGATFIDDPIVMSQPFNNTGVTTGHNRNAVTDATLIINLYLAHPNLRAEFKYSLGEITGHNQNNAYIQVIAFGRWK